MRAAPILLAALFPGLLLAQAWLPDEGTFNASFVYNDTLNKKHYLPDGSEVDVGHTRSQSFGLIASYGLSERFMVTAGLPFVRSRYTGPRPHPTHIDDGHTHETFTDLRIELHYQAVEEPLALAPYVAFVLPVTDYETLGHAAPGRGLEESWIGFFAGKSLDAWIPRTYVQARYNYAFVEKVAGIAHDRSNADVEIGFFVDPTWSVRAVAAWQDTHGGIPVPVPPTHPLFHYHDQLAAESYLNVGGGIAYSWSERVDFYSLYMTSLSGRSGHKLDHGVTLGIAFRTRAR